MRIKDLRWYILASVILIISYAAVALCYFLPVRAKAEVAMSSLGHETTVNITQMTNSKLQEIFEEFTIDASSLDSNFNQTGLRSKFYAKYSETFSTSTLVLFDRHDTFQPLDSQGSSFDIDTKFYFYFWNEDRTLCGRMPVEEAFTFVNDFDLYLIDISGTIYFSKPSLYTKMENAFGVSSFDFFRNGLSDNGSFLGLYSIQGERGVFASERFLDNYYISTFIPITSPYLAVEWVIVDAMVFYIVGISIIIAMLVIFVFGCRKASRLLRVDRHAVEKTNSIVIRVDKDGKVIFTNRTFKQIYGLQKLENIDNFLDVDSKESIMTDIKANRSFECQVDVNGTDRYFHLTPLYILSSYYLMGTDVTIDYLRRKHLETMSGKNEITGCDNSFTLTNQYRHIIMNSNYYDISFVEYNISKYDEIIGVFGRQNFNILLNEFLAILQNNYKDLGIYHMNDSKFMVIYPTLKFEDVIEKINTSLEILRKPISIGRNHIYVKCKIVVYNLKKEDSETVTLEEIKNKLDLALKNIADFSSKDYIVYEPAMDNVIEAAEEMEQDLIRGINNEEFRMYLQPQYNIVSNVVDGFEALIRWENPKYFDKSPQAFIELAEQRGYMLDIGRFVIKESFALAKKLEPYGVHVSVNVSPIQLLQVGFVGELIDEFRRLELKPGSVAIEITETFLMGNFQLVTEKLKRLKEMGFHIHLDDFCTGYSSLLYLKDLPVDTLKIDKEFTKYIETSKVHASIVRTIISLGISLDLDIICEGVENQIQSDIVKKMGCKIIQGYLIGKAMPYEDAVALLEKYNRNKK